MSTHPLPAWTGPRWVAHRGAGKLAPENTLAAFRLGASLGWRAYECDVKLSADGVPFLLHDATLARTLGTDLALEPALAGDTVAGTLPWSRLARLDAGAWHGRAHAGEAPPSLEAIARWCLAQGHELNIEIKPTPGEDERTGTVVAAAVRTLWGEAVAAGRARWPLLSSFRPAALAAAREAAPELPRALLLDTLWNGPEPDLAPVDPGTPDLLQATCLRTAAALGCGALVLNHRLIPDAAFVERLHAAGWQVLAYTVNEAERAHALLAWGLAAVITDAVDRFCPAR